MQCEYWASKGRPRLLPLSLKEMFLLLLIHHRADPGSTPTLHCSAEKQAMIFKSRSLWAASELQCAWKRSVRSDARMAVQPSTPGMEPKPHGLKEGVEITNNAWTTLTIPGKKIPWSCYFHEQPEKQEREWGKAPSQGEGRPGCDQNIRDHCRAPKDDWHRHSSPLWRAVGLGPGGYRVLHSTTGLASTPLHPVHRNRENPAQAETLGSFSTSAVVERSLRSKTETCRYLKQHLLVTLKKAT